MPQMSPMDWLILSMFFLIIYFLSLMFIYFLFKFNFNKNLVLKLNNFFIKW